MIYTETWFEKDHLITAKVKLIINPAPRVKGSVQPSILKGRCRKMWQGLMDWLQPGAVIGLGKAVCSVFRNDNEAVMFVFVWLHWSGHTCSKCETEHCDWWSDMFVILHLNIMREASVWNMVRQKGKCLPGLTVFVSPFCAEEQFRRPTHLKCRCSLVRWHLSSEGVMSHLCLGWHLIARQN